jgi:regulator of protease activity HflC (stomatin/prohibitin superfamily)
VERASDAIIKLQDFRFAISQYARTSLRDAIRQMTLDQLLTEREEIESAIVKHVERDTGAWGLDVVGIRLEDIDMPDSERGRRIGGSGRSPHGYLKTVKELRCLCFYFVSGSGRI